MNGPILRILAFLALATPAATSAWAAPPPTSGGSPQSPTSESTAKSPSEFQSLGIDRRLTKVAGVVLDMSDRPVPGVDVTLFVDGGTVGSATTDPTGSYEFMAAYDASADVTAILWFVAAERSLVAKEIVLQESRTSRENTLISRCVPRATLTPGRQFRVYLFDAPNRNKELAELDCLP
jgi:hypothetical protein